VFPKGKQGVWSQLPMLVLMVLLTTIGLRILSLPIAAGQVQDPLPQPSSSAEPAFALATADVAFAPKTR
jgi:hypothetical protein